MHIRRATIADLDRLLDLERCFSTDRLSRRGLRHLLRRGHAEFWVYEDVNTVSGDIAVFYRRGSRSARIYSLAVDPAHRRRGVARALVAAAEKGAMARGRDAIRLEVRCDNSAALRLYERCGYRVVARIEHFYEDRAPALRMEKIIAPRRVSLRRMAPECGLQSDAAEMIQSVISNGRTLARGLLSRFESGASVGMRQPGRGLVRKVTGPRPKKSTKAHLSHPRTVTA